MTFFGAINMCFEKRMLLSRRASGAERWCFGLCAKSQPGPNQYGPNPYEVAQ
ncbi:MAG: hypothetical protein AB3N21_12990 [Ruegeria sp.]|uniref:hypothetical protein n=1 Tax=Ruegeria sp. TaxID=1879320 RepID=UPI00349EBBE7